VSNRQQQQKQQGGKAPFTAQAQTETPVPAPVVETPAPEPSDGTKNAVADAQVQADLVQQAVQAKVQPEREFLAPYFDFAGANLGGQSVYVCEGCWALVLRDSQDAHVGWHRRIEGF
jgi:hypothetical protein